LITGSGPAAPERALKGPPSVTAATPSVPASHLILWSTNCKEPRSGTWGKRVRLCALVPEGNLEAGLEDQPVPRRGRPKADAHVQLDIVAETQVHTRVELVHLLAARQRTAEQPGLTVVLDAQRDPLADRDADASLERGGPAGDVTHVCLELPHLTRCGFGAVHRDLEGILRDGLAQRTDRPEQQHGHKTSPTGVHPTCHLCLE